MTARLHLYRGNFCFDILLKNILIAIYFMVFFKDSYTCEFSKENCTMEQLNSKTIKWVYRKTKYRFGKY